MSESILLDIDTNYQKMGQCFNLNEASMTSFVMFRNYPRKGTLKYQQQNLNIHYLTFLNMIATVSDLQELKENLNPGLSVVLWVRHQADPACLKNLQE